MLINTNSTGTKDISFYPVEKTSGMLNGNEKHSTKYNAAP